ncbi:hypothetical protein ABUW04_38535 [Streptacidiphilus sp. N1-10]|uniref:GNAT family N-acetyltransferase n=1 Tax=Streptacidiphilus jeojiensis TaxID=3229225 RepID=A0ABV6Y1B1_9ACTN
MIRTATDRRTWIRAAAWNNAEWCAAVCRTHRQDPGTAGGGTFARGLWSSDGTPPPLYPDVVTLDPAATGAQAVARIELTPATASVKDSFDCLDLAGVGFSPLFEAQWIIRAPEERLRPVPGWSVVRDADGLAAWATAWDGGQGYGEIFRSELLDQQDVAVLQARDRDGRVLAGAVANRSATVAGVVGLSNVFATEAAERGLLEAWADASAVAGRHWPGLPVVGYEHGEDLDSALIQGFDTLGPLKVWIRW